VGGCRGERAIYFQLFLAITPTNISTSTFPSLSLDHGASADIADGNHYWVVNSTYQEVFHQIHTDQAIGKQA
jgi:hypothetical protein